MDSETIKILKEAKIKLSERQNKLIDLAVNENSDLSEDEINEEYHFIRTSLDTINKILTADYKNQSKKLKR